MVMKQKLENQGKRKGNLSILLDKSNQSFYWLGFLMADGCVSKQYGRIILNTVENDKEHLEKFAIYLGTKMNVVRYKGKTLNNPQPYSAYSVAIQYPSVVDSLINMMDFRPQKTYNPPSPKILSAVLNTKKKFLSFLVGFIDGDGCIFQQSGRYRMRIVNHKSWYEIHRFFFKMLKKHNLYNGNADAHILGNKYSSMQISNPETLKKIYGIVSEKIPLMKRKWDKVIL